MQEGIPEADIELVKSLAQLGSAQFASDLRRLLKAAQAVSRSDSVRYLYLGATFDFETWPASPLGGLTVHVCACPLCNKDRVSVSWKEEILDASQTRRILGGLAVAGEPDDEAEQDWVPGTLDGHRADNLTKLVEVTHAVDCAAEIVALTNHIRGMMETTPVDYIGFYMIVAVRRPSAVTDIQFHWCDREECKEDAAVGRRRPTTLGKNGLPQTVRVCGYGDEVVPRWRSPLVFGGSG